MDKGYISISAQHLAFSLTILFGTSLSAPSAIAQENNKQQTEHTTHKTFATIMPPQMLQIAFARFYSGVGNQQLDSMLRDRPSLDKWGHLGDGYDLVGQKYRLSCFDREHRLNAVPVNERPRVYVSVNYASTSLQLQNVLNASLNSSGSLDYLGASGSASFSVAYSGEKSLSSDQRALVATVVVEEGDKELARRPSPKDFVEGVPAISHREEFMTACGAQYVSETMLRARLSVVLLINASNSDERTKLDQQFHGSFDGDYGVVAASGDLDEAVSMLKNVHKEESDVRLEYEAEGFFGQIERDPNKLFSLVLNFPSLVSQCKVVDDALKCNKDQSNRMFLAQVPASFEDWPGLEDQKYVQEFFRAKAAQSELNSIRESLQYRAENGPLGSSDEAYEYWPKLSNEEWHHDQNAIDDSLLPALDSVLNKCKSDLELCTPAETASALRNTDGVLKYWRARFHQVSMTEVRLCPSSWGQGHDRCFNTASFEDLEPLVTISAGQVALVKLDGKINVEYRERKGDRISITPLEAANVSPGGAKIQLKMAEIGNDVSLNKASLSLRPAGLPTADAGWCVAWPNENRKDDLQLSLYMSQGGADPNVHENALGDDLRDWASQDFRAKIWVLDRALISSSERWSGRCRVVQ